MAHKTRRSSNKPVLATPEMEVELFKGIEEEGAKQRGRAAYRERRGPSGLSTDELKAHDDARDIERFREKHGI